jgi:hypothetical protein
MHPIHRRAVVTCVSALAGVLLLLVGAGPASAHHTSLRVPLVPAGSAPPIRLDGSGRFELLAAKGGEIRFTLSGAVDAVSGLPASATGNRLRASFLVNGVPQVNEVVFTITQGKVRSTTSKLGLQTNDAVEVRGVTLETSGGAVFAAIGVRSTGPTLSSALVNVNSPSPIVLANSHDADVHLAGRAGGKLTVRFDRITPPDAPDNRAELEYSLNGGPPTVFTSPPFDIVDDLGKLIAPLHLTLGPGDVLHVLRLEVLDQNGDPFAALGVRITSP